jgi:hypothetical protein
MDKMTVRNDMLELGFGRIKGILSSLKSGIKKGNGKNLFAGAVSFLCSKKNAA